jgi:hypothetical protein
MSAGALAKVGIDHKAQISKVQPCPFTFFRTPQIILLIATTYTGNSKPFTTKTHPSCAVLASL